jgi:hypothetical protein
MTPEPAKLLTESDRAMGSKVPAIYGNSFDEKMQM